MAHRGGNIVADRPAGRQTRTGFFNGDELDIDHRRVDLELLKLLDLPPDSQLHWFKCYYVGGVSVVDEYVRVSYRFPRERPDYEGLIVPLVEDEIRARLAKLEGIFRSEGVKVALGPSQVRLMRLVQPLPEGVEREMGKWGSGGVGEWGSGQVGKWASGELRRELAERVGAGTATSRPAPVRPEKSGQGGSSATLKGSGAIAQGGSAAAAAGGTVVIGDVGGDVVSGDKSVGLDQRGARIGAQINVAGDYVEGRSPGSLSPAATAELQGLEAALDELQAQYNKGLIDVGRYLQLKAEFETRRAKLRRR